MDQTWCIRFRLEPISEEDGPRGRKKKKKEKGKKEEWILQTHDKEEK